MTEFPVSFPKRKKKKRKETHHRYNWRGNGFPYPHPLIPDCTHALVFLRILHTHRKDIIKKRTEKKNKVPRVMVYHTIESHAGNEGDNNTPEDYTTLYSGDWASRKMVVKSSLHCVVLSPPRITSGMIIDIVLMEEIRYSHHHHLLLLSILFSLNTE